MSTFEAIIYEVDMQKINCNLRFFVNSYLRPAASSCSLGEKNIGNFKSTHVCPYILCLLLLYCITMFLV